ncbi:SWIM zinc finger domain-containing protein [Gordonia sp. HY002]|uniref:SWIM zinc finger family protein n=1 Tax=Gordonia zhenghanii TaxID=2911516 RepID=UPI001F379D23|nr:SWIM zinc finger family protein [Gordonia zhenghanii]MCF8570710.1 SWIM zinc finger domain-containing protein [Gordonia zhenghanii]
MPWTQEKVLAAAPDSSSVAAGRKLATPGPWSSTGSTDELLWGSCQGSGKKPYQVSIDLTGPAYRCSCPSRKFPCKHAIALLLLWSAGAIDGGEVAAFAADWASDRAERSARADRPTAAPDPEAQAARRAERLATMDAGVADFVQWLADLARGGLSQALRRPVAWWEAAAARLVDGQLPGLAERVRDTGADAARGLDAAELLQRVGVWWMLVRAWGRRDLLSPESVADLYAAVGLPTPTSLVRDGERRSGVWTVLGAHRDEKGRLSQQRTWLRGDDGEIVMTLETAGPGQSLGVPQLAGARLAAEIALYPGHRPRRALFVDPPEVLEPAASLGSGGSVDDALAAAAAALATVPWRDRHPVCIDDVAMAGDAFDHVVDSAGSAIRLTPDTPTRALLAATGGHADQLFGELDGGLLRALTVIEGGEVTVL